MSKVYVKKAILRDKLYIEKGDVEESDLVAAYTYHNGEEYFSTLSESEDYWMVPVNSYHKLDMEEIIDERQYEPLDYKLEFSGTLREEQQEALDNFLINGRVRSGLLHARCGWGKTFTGSAMIAQNSVKTLVLVHTKLLFRQWISEIENLIEDIDVGKIGDNLYQIEDVTVAIYKTVYNNLDELRDEFSMIMVDEAHLCPAEMFSTVVNNLNAKIKVAITATPKRKDGKHVFLPDFFTPFRFEARDPNKAEDPIVRIIQTGYKFRVVNPKLDWTKQVTKLTEDEEYLELIAKTANGYIKQGRCPLILGDRVEMLKKLSGMIPGSALMIGETDERARESTLDLLGRDIKAILSTKLFDEGISAHRLDTLLVTCPNNNVIKLEQRIGRIIREHPDKFYPLLVDFWLLGRFVDRQQKNRLLWYKKQGYTVL